MNEIEALRACLDTAQRNEKALRELILHCRMAMRNLPGDKAGLEHLAEVIGSAQMKIPLIEDYLPKTELFTNPL